MTPEEVDTQIKELKDNYNSVQQKLDKLEKKVDLSPTQDLFSPQYELYREQLAFCIDQLNEQERSDLLHWVLKDIYVDYEENKGHQIEIVWAIPVLEEGQVSSTIPAGKFPSGTPLFRGELADYSVRIRARSDRHEIITIKLFS